MTAPRGLRSPVPARARARTAARALARNWAWAGAAACCCLLVMVAGCGSKEPTKEEPMNDGAKQPGIEQVSASTKSDIDALAARLGSNASVRQEFVGDCEPHQPELGKNFTYMVHVAVQPGALARLRGEIAEELAGQGWTVKQDPDESVRFAKDGANMGASVWEDQGTAAVGGTSACVRD